MIRQYRIVVLGQAEKSPKPGCPETYHPVSLSCEKCGFESKVAGIQVYNQDNSQPLVVFNFHAAFHQPDSL